MILCHSVQTTLLVWNISLRVCYKLQNLQLADTFISLSIRSICFCLYFHFSVFLHSVRQHFALALSLSFSLCHLISPPHCVFYVYPSGFSFWARFTCVFFSVVSGLLSLLIPGFLSLSLSRILTSLSSAQITLSYSKITPTAWSFTNYVWGQHNACK